MVDGDGESRVKQSHPCSPNAPLFLVAFWKRPFSIRYFLEADTKLTIRRFRNVPMDPN